MGEVLEPIMEASFAFATQAMHAGERVPKPDFTPVNTPIYQSASLAIAQWLADHARIPKVFYPGLAHHPGHHIARRLLRESCFGLVPSFALVDGDRERIVAFLSSLQVCLLTTTLGDAYTELLYPTMSSHRLLTPGQRATIGISDALIRLSAGIEDVGDLIGDLHQALQKVA
jgi:cystathionine beta-lyase/cystathionine gamma-synthase